jgi:hypothetical protein
MACGVGEARGRVEELVKRFLAKGIEARCCGVEGE